MVASAFPPNLTEADISLVPSKVSARIVPLLNHAEMLLVFALTLTISVARTSTALAWRGRTRADAVRFSHSADIAERMTSLFEYAQDSNRLGVEHLDTIWLRINRHLASVVTEACDDIRACIDAVVEPAVLDWLATHDRLVNLADLRDVVDSALLSAVPELAAETSRVERDSARLTRKGSVLTLRCGDEIMAASIDAAVEMKAKRLLAGLRREHEEKENLPEVPTRSELKAQILLELLGDNSQSLHVRVNLYRETIDGNRGTGPAFGPEVGWIDATTAERFEELARTSGTVAMLPGDPAQLPQTDSYRWPVLQEMAMDSRDGHCRFPGCTVPAVRCDNDHIINSVHTDPTSDGPTSITNGQKLCPEHHRLKTARIWSCSTPDEGHTIIWFGPHGEQVSTCATGPLSRSYRACPEEEGCDGDE